MAKQSTYFVCQKCGAKLPKWQGQCDNCGSWNSLVETVIATQEQKLSFGRLAAGQKQNSQPAKPLKLTDIKAKTFKRLKTGIVELDRVLGGGIVPGSLVLIAGEPGIGKSTLLTQLALELAKSKNKSILYICGEESPAQIKIRIKRLIKIKNLEPRTNDKKNNSKKFLSSKFQVLNSKLFFLPETNIENILSVISNQQLASSLIIVDSIQTIWNKRLTGIAGSVGQVRECANLLLLLAKKTNIPIFLVGHITKEGAVAGPKVLEHLVDTVLYLEGDKQHDFRILRTYKNRFGPTDEVGIFKMTDKGMEQVKNSADVFLDSKNKNLAYFSGRSTVVSMQGIRPMLIEIQALTASSQLAMPRRTASGIDYKKLQVLVAVLQKWLGLPLYQHDVFINVAGGLKLNEPAIDLGICLAIVSSFKNKPLAPKSVCIGEVGLLGEIRKVSFMEKRIKQAKKLGYKTIIGIKETTLKQTLKYLAL